MNGFFSGIVGAYLALVVDHKFMVVQTYLCDFIQ